MTTRSGTLSRAIGIDVGGTSLRALVVDEGGRVLRRQRTSSAVGDVATLIDSIVKAVEGFDLDAPIGLGVAGLVDLEGTLVTSPNLALHDVPIGARLTRCLGRPVTVVNDAAAAAFAEHCVGAAQGQACSLTVTIGTGIGSGIVIDGHSLLGARGFAAELGHVIVDPTGALCACGHQGCLEAVASGSAIGRQAMAIGLPDAPAVVAAAARGDLRAQEILADAGTNLGRVLAMAVTMLDPDVVVIGGGAGTAAAPWIIPEIRGQLNDLVFAASLRTLPTVVPAALGDDAGAVGVALMAAGAAASHELEGR